MSEVRRTQSRRELNEVSFGDVDLGRQLLPNHVGDRLFRLHVGVRDEVVRLLAAHGDAVAEVVGDDLAAASRRRAGGRQDVIHSREGSMR